MILIEQILSLKNNKKSISSLKSKHMKEFYPILLIFEKLNFERLLIDYLVSYKRDIKIINRFRYL